MPAGFDSDQISRRSHGADGRRRFDIESRTGSCGRNSDQNENIGHTLGERADRFGYPQRLHRFFSKMTASVVAVVTDVKRNGKRVVGYGFNSNGRYAQSGLMRERFIPRIMSADPKSLLNDAGDNLDPHRIWACMMANEKPGGHGERSVAVGVDRHGGVGRGGKDRRQSRCTGCSPSATAAAGPTTRCSSMPRAATTIRARTCRRCRTR